MRFGAWAGAAALVLSASPAFAVIPLNGEIAAEAGANLDGAADDGAAYANWFGPPAQAIHQILVTNSQGQAVTAGARGGAGSFGPTAGGFRFNLEGDGSDTDGLPFSWFSRGRWYYDFIAEATGTFTLTYAFSGSGLDAATWTFWETGDEGPSGAVGLSGLSSSGSVERTLVAGQTYNLQIAFGLEGKPANGARADDVEGIFSWSITEGSTVIPEPATWALLIAGFGLTGAMLRRRPPAL